VRGGGGPTGGGAPTPQPTTRRRGQNGCQAVPTAIDPRGGSSFVNSQTSSGRARNQKADACPKPGRVTEGREGRFTPSKQRGASPLGLPGCPTHAGLYATVRPPLRPRSRFKESTVLLRLLASPKVLFFASPHKPRSSQTGRLPQARRRPRFQADVPGSAVDNNSCGDHSEASCTPWKRPCLRSSSEKNGRLGEYAKPPNRRPHAPLDWQGLNL